jgi:hypothetical protein
LLQPTGHESYTDFLGAHKLKNARVNKFTSDWHIHLPKQGSFRPTTHLYFL